MPGAVPGSLKENTHVNPLPLCCSLRSAPGNVDGMTGALAAILDPKNRVSVLGKLERVLEEVGGLKGLPQQKYIQALHCLPSGCYIEKKFLPLTSNPNLL